MNKFEKLIQKCNESILNGCNKYSDEQIRSIAANCIGLSETWFNNNKSVDKESYEVRLYNDDGIVCETLHGVTRDNLPEIMMNTFVNGKGKYSLLSLHSYKFEHGTKIELNELGKADIS